MSHTHDEKKTPLEAFIESLKSFITKYKTAIISAVVVIVLVAVALVGFSIYTDSVEKKSLAGYQKIMNDFYDKIVTLEEASEREQLGNDTAQKILELAKGTGSGYIHTYGHYIAAGLFFQSQDFENAKKNYQIFLSKYSKNDLAPLAKLQSALCSEWLGDFDSAQSEYFVLLEEESDGSDLLAQVLYSLGRVSSKNGNDEKAKEYYNRVITEYPRTEFEKLATKSLMLIDYNK